MARLTCRGKPYQLQPGDSLIYEPRNGTFLIAQGPKSDHPMASVHFESSDDRMDNKRRIALKNEAEFYQFVEILAATHGFDVKMILDRDDRVWEAQLVASRSISLR